MATSLEAGNTTGSGRRPLEDERRLRLVLDTNVVLDLVVFRDAGAEPLRAAVQVGQVTLLTSAECLAELRRVLAYPEFKRDPVGQAAAYDWYATRVEQVEPAPLASVLPRCRDADDQKFLEIAWLTQADHLVTKDRALLELARRIENLGKFSVTHPDALAQLLSAAADQP